MKVKALTYNQLQTLCWTEDNRLQAVKDNHMGAYYNYDASGERNLKLTGAVVQMSQNGVPYDYVMLESPTLYASGLITINERGYTKHYFEENKRVCSNIGGGFRDAGYDIMEPIGLITSFEEQLGNAKDGIFNTFEQCIKSPVDLENTKDKIVNVMKDHEKDRNEEEYQFYYTNDHLGSSTYITNKEGQITQTLAYLPYGEDWVDLDNHPPYLTSYKFNGKEKDEETGYNNYGARYLNPTLSIWLSVDPMSDKRPNLTSYNYCQNNPIILIDPDGNLDDHYLSEEEGKYLGDDGAVTDNVRIIPKDTWDNIKTTNQDGTETVNHYVGFANSKSFSKGAENMSEESKLNVFRHFNTTNLPLGSYINAGENYMCFDDDGDPQSILINLKINNVSNNANNIINSFGHEKDHYDLYQEIGGIEYGKKGNNFIEQRAIRKQMTLPSWEKTTIEYKEAIRDYGFRHRMFFNDFKPF